MRDRCALDWCGAVECVGWVTGVEAGGGAGGAGLGDGGGCWMGYSGEKGARCRWGGRCRGVWRRRRRVRLREGFEVGGGGEGVVGVGGRLGESRPWVVERGNRGTDLGVEVCSGWGWRGSGGAVAEGRLAEGGRVG